MNYEEKYAQSLKSAKPVGHALAENKTGQQVYEMVTHYLNLLNTVKPMERR